jgi:hypothetical protein
VDGIVQAGHFTASHVGETLDVDRLLSEALAFPMARSVLLAPDVERIAVGAVVREDVEHPSLSAMIATYSLFSAEAHAEQARKVYAAFDAARRERGLGPAERLHDVEGLSMEAAGMVQAGSAPDEALQSLLEVSVELLQRPVNGWIAEANDLADIEFPEDFLTRRAVGVAVGVSHHRASDEPWGHYVVMMVASDPPSHSI